RLTKVWDGDWAAYKSLKNHYNRLIKSTMRQHYQEKIHNNSDILPIFNVQLTLYRTLKRSNTILPIWLSANKLTLNKTKTEYMIIGTTYGVSQSDPKSLDEAVKLALRLESIHLAEMKNNNTAKINMAGDERDTAGFDMAGARDKRDTAGLNMAGAKEEDQSTPRWAKKYFDQQAELMDKMSKFLEQTKYGLIPKTSKRK
ncbi:Hypothetical predicted protein, partial [Paramuricea clavata]